MRKTILLLVSVALITVFFKVTQLSHADSDPFGDTKSIAFATELWQKMQDINLVGRSAKRDKPYKGTHPHGAVLETLSDTLTLNGHTGQILVKRGYGGAGVSIAAVNNDPGQFIRDVTVMFKREKGYDDLNQDWFWAKFNPDGKLETNPRGRKLAGRVAKGKAKGCIACHEDAPGGDYLFVK